MINYEKNMQYLSNSIEIGVLHLNELKLIHGEQEIDPTSRLIKLNFGRRFGHTSFIINNAKIKDILIVPDNSFKNDLKYKGISYDRVYTINQVIKGSLRGLIFNTEFTIWIDNASYINIEPLLREFRAIKENYNIIALG